jgi:aldehyde:ferredoxin oxidoreductase
MNIWRVNLGDNSLKVEECPAGWMGLGGRGLIARILVDEVDPRCDPLGPENKLIFAPGLLVGHHLSSCDRISVGTKSPLTGGVKETNAGGTTGYQLAKLGIKALILEGSPASGGLSILVFDGEGMKVLPAKDLAGAGVYRTAEVLRERYGNKAALAIIGPGGERQMTGAGI